MNRDKSVMEGRMTLKSYKGKKKKKKITTLVQRVFNSVEILMLKFAIFQFCAQGGSKPFDSRSFRQQNRVV